MVKLNTIGSKGEEIAVKFLLNKGYAILERNWRNGQKEIDIIALHKDVVVFLEVKTRANFDFGFPEEAVTKKKQRFLKQAAEAYIAANPQYLQIQFDIISIVMVGDNVQEIVHFEEAFY